MKKLIASLTILATGAALASSVSSTATFGVLKITSDAQETAISVPWVAAGTGSDVLVKDFVKTSNLHANDRLLVYNPEMNDGNGGYKGWYLSTNAGAWTGYGVAYGNIVSITAGGNTETLARGDALILIRTPESLAETDHAIYLYGQYDSAEMTSYQMAQSSSAAKQTLFAPINVSGTDLDLNTGFDWGYVDVSTQKHTGDMIKVQAANTGAAIYLVCKDVSGSYKWVHSFTESAEAAKIKPGMGAWYIATTNTTGRVNIGTWDASPTQPTARTK